MNSCHSNYSAYGLVAFWVLFVLPHAIGPSIWKYLNYAPRSEAVAGPEKAVAGPEAVIAGPEEAIAGPEKRPILDKLEGIQRDSLDVFPLFAVAVILGTIADLRDPVCLNSYVLTFFGLRIFHSLVYIYGTSQNWDRLRTASWVLSTAVLIRIILQAGKKLSDKIILSL